MNILGGLLAFLVSACVSLLNGFITYRMLKKKNVNGKLVLVFALRQVINFGILFTVYLLRNSFPVPFVYLLVGAAMGIITPTIILAICFSRRLKSKP